LPTETDVAYFDIEKDDAIALNITPEPYQIVNRTQATS